MEDIIASVQQIAKTADEAGRKKLIDGLTSLVWSIEGPQDFMQRILYQHMYLAVVRVGVDLKFFNIIHDSSTPVTAQEVAAKCGAAPRLTARLLRYLASFGAFTETASDTYAANKITKLLSEPAWQSAIYHNFDTCGPIMLAMPDFLQETAYRDIEDSAHNPFTKAFGVSESQFDWFPKHPQRWGHVANFMTVQRSGMPTWLDRYPYRERLRDLAPDQPLFVDIGGNVGHQSVALREAIPADVANRIIVQDMASMAPMTRRAPGVEFMEYDFTTPQPIRGARMYYLRNIIHDWPDERAAAILRNQAAAMGPDSVLLIDDMVLPDTGAHWHAAQLDVLMMSALGACERSHAQHAAVIAAAGLTIRKVYQYTDSLSDCVIECVVA